MNNKFKVNNNESIENTNVFFSGVVCIPSKKKKLTKFFFPVFNFFFFFSKLQNLIF